MQHTNKQTDKVFSNNNNLIATIIVQTTTEIYILTWSALSMQQRTVGLNSFKAPTKLFQNF